MGARCFSLAFAWVTPLFQEVAWRRPPKPCAERCQKAQRVWDLCAFGCASRCVSSREVFQPLPCGALHEGVKSIYCKELLRVGFIPSRALPLSSLAPSVGGEMLDDNTTCRSCGLLLLKTRFCTFLRGVDAAGVKKCSVPCYSWLKFLIALTISCFAYFLLVLRFPGVVSVLLTLCECICVAQSRSQTLFPPQAARSTPALQTLARLKRWLCICAVQLGVCSLCARL